jgi:hypothetical protein
MQLHLQTDELNLLANVLMETGGTMPRLRLDEKLLEMVLAHDLRFDSDELERVAALLAAEERAVLERGLEKVDEACVMI